LSYLTDYCTHFGLWPNIHLNTTVKSVTRDPRYGGKHTVTYLIQATGETHQWECDAVAVCSGLHVTPNIPDNIPGIENIPVRMHSSEFKTRSQFLQDSGRDDRDALNKKGKTVMVLGTGETGADVSYMAVTTPGVDRVLLCHRSGFHLAPKVSCFFTAFVTLSALPICRILADIEV